MPKNYKLIGAAVVSAAILLTQAHAAQLTTLSGEPRMTGLVERAQIKDKQGNIHTRYVQTVKGIPVYGHQVIEHQYQASHLKNEAFPLARWTGTWVEGIESDLEATAGLRLMDSKAALTHFKNLFSSDKAYPVAFENEVVEDVIYIDEENKARRAVSIAFFTDSPEGGNPSWPHYIVDATTWEVLKSWEGLTTQAVGTGPGGNGKTGYYEYGSTRPYMPFDVEVASGKCVMQSADEKAVHMQNRMIGNPSTYSYACDPRKSNYRHDLDAVNGAHSPLNDAYSFGSVVVDMYEDWYDQKPLPFELVLRVHYGKDFVNAFWNGSNMTFGDGNVDYYPLTTLDVTSHEIAHGVTQFASNLEYEGQAGGLNESFSDMAAKAAEFYLFGAHDWTIGGTVSKKRGTAFRYMDEPTKDGVSISMASDFTAKMDPHLSSGVYNKAFYLLATTPGWTTKTAFDVMYSANLNYWTPTSDFATAGWGAIVSAYILGYSYTDVMNALSAVGVNCSVATQSCRI